jgi:hypothetical protein
MSKILVNGSKVARVDHKPKLEVAPSGVATDPDGAGFSLFTYIFQ